MAPEMLLDTGIEYQINRISNAVEDIKAAITEIGGTVADSNTVDDLANIIRSVTPYIKPIVFYGSTDPGDLTEDDLDELGIDAGDVYIYVPKLN